jgi:voltage-gated potassium channel
MDRLVRRMGYIGGAVLFTVLVGTIGFVMIEGYSVLDAFYMTLITMTTVGYNEVRPLTETGRVFNSILIVFGVTTLFLAIGAMTQTIIELELGEFFGKRRMKRMIEKLENHYIICGFGRVGNSAAWELKRAGVPFVVVDLNPERVEAANTAGMLAVQADSTQDQTLRDVGVARARGLIVMGESDNLERLERLLAEVHS